MLYKCWNWTWTSQVCLLTMFIMIMTKLRLSQGSFAVAKKQLQTFITVPYFFVFTWSYGVILGLLTYRDTDLSATLRHLFCLHFHHLHHRPSSALLKELKVSSYCSPVSSVARVPDYRTGGCEFKHWPDQQPGSLTNW